MKIGFVLFDGMTTLDFIGPYDALTRLRSMSLLPDVSWDLAAWSEPVTDSQGLVLHPTCLRVTKAADGSFFNKVVKTVPDISQTLGLPEAEFKKMGLGSRDVPDCRK